MNFSAPHTVCKKAKIKYNKAKMVKINTNIVQSLLRLWERHISSGTLSFCG